MPLHIFEDRYKAMIGECLDDGREFGIVWAADDGLKANGCAMEVTEVLERHEDGRLDILTRGTRPVPDRRGALRPRLPGGRRSSSSTTRTSRPTPATVEAAHEAYGDLVEEATDKVLEPEVLEPLTAYEMAATVDFGPRRQAGPARPALRERAAAAA